MPYPEPAIDNLIGEAMRMENRDYYEKLFEAYPDVVSMETLMEMLGGVSISFARRILRQGIIKNFILAEKAYMIPKQNVIDYVVSPAYQEYKHKLKSQI